MIHENIEKQAEEKKPHENWILTFADLISLIIVFFILTYAMSALKPTRWQEIKKSFSTRLNPNIVEKIYIPEATKFINRVNIPLSADIEYLRAIIYEKILPTGVLEKIQLQALNDRIVISIRGNLFADAGNSLNPETQRIVTIVSEAVVNLNNQIVVVYSDSLKEKDWQTSLLRPAYIAAFISQNGYQYPISYFTMEDKDKETYKLKEKIDIVIKDKSAGIF